MMADGAFFSLHPIVHYRTYIYIMYLIPIKKKKHFKYTNNCIYFIQGKMLRNHMAFSLVAISHRWQMRLKYERMRNNIFQLTFKTIVGSRFVLPTFCYDLNNKRFSPIKPVPVINGSSYYYLSLHLVFIHNIVESKNSWLLTKRKQTLTNT